VVVAWRKLFPGDVRDVVLARSDDRGSSFSAPVRVHDDGWRISGCPHAGPAVAFDGAGRVRVAWYTGREGAAGLYLASSADGGRSYSEPVALIAGDGVPPSQVALEPDATGAVWLGFEDAAEARIVVARWQAGAAPVRLGEPMQGKAPAVAAAPGLRAIAWLDGEAVRVRVARRVP
jgi:hypothetical protein